MPKRLDIKKILVIGSGPIVIGQACEFDYSGTQACRVLKQEGYKVVLANSNPATIMTDPDFADATYIEPLTVEFLTKIISEERPDAILPTLGGQTALNLAMGLSDAGILDMYDIELIGANAEAIELAENRQKFKEAMLEIGLDVPRSGIATTMSEAREILEDIGLPVIVRPAYILGGHGTGIAASIDEFETIAKNGLQASPISEILIEESIVGWKEYELEVMRDKADNQVIVCSIENFDAMGVHTGDSITVAPIQTLTDKEYQSLRQSAFACLRRVGVETGGSNVQFAVDPKTGRQVIIEMNPRVSRSSALASKATGFPIAKIAAKLAIGYTLDEIPNDITRKTPASFEPVIDYVITKIPRWAFEKLPGTKPILGTAMQSVGEVMAVGSTFIESLQKACRSLENGHQGLNSTSIEHEFDGLTDVELKASLAIPSPDRLFQIESAIRRGYSIEELHKLTYIDPWFIDQIVQIVEQRRVIESWPEIPDENNWMAAKQFGFSDAQIAYLTDSSEENVRKDRLNFDVKPVFKRVDTCAGEFEADTPYFYSTYMIENEYIETTKEKILILGSGPNRIGQGIEFDYCCVHASYALSEAGYETIMLNCNPETVSTDYDTSDRLYFEPITYEDVMNVIDNEKPVGIIVSLGGQTPLKLANLLPKDLILGTAPESIDLAEDRKLWNQLCTNLSIPFPPGDTASTLDEALVAANSINYPVLIRPSYVLGGRAMEIVYSDQDLISALKSIESLGSLGKEGGLSAQRPVLIDKFLEGAVEVDVDAIRDSSGEVMIGGIMEHVEEAGVHSGDSTCIIPPRDLSDETIECIKSYTQRLAEGLDVVGLINIQFVVCTNQDKSIQVYVIEANPRASRTVPFVSKATNVPLVKVASRVMTGQKIADLKETDLIPKNNKINFWAVKAPVLPFNRFPDTDALIGPEMRSTGEVMGVDASSGVAYMKSQIASLSGLKMDVTGCIFMSLADKDKNEGVEIAKQFHKLGFEFIATEGTAEALEKNGIEVSKVANRLSVAKNNTALDYIHSGDVSLVINTPRGRGSRADGAYIRIAANQNGIPLITTLSAARAVSKGMSVALEDDMSVNSLQKLHSQI